MKHEIVCWFCMAMALFAVGVSYAVDFTVSTPTTMSEEQSAIYYETVYVNADLTIDGNDRGLTNSSSIVIGGSASAPVTVVITNGAKWVVRQARTMTFVGKGGTIIASSPTEWDFRASGNLNLPIGDNIPVASIATVGYYTDVVLDANAEASGGVMDILRLLPNGTVSFRQVKNRNQNVAARILFDGGTHWVYNQGASYPRFVVEDNSRILLESVDGNPIEIRWGLNNWSLFSGVGTLETKGNGDFLLNKNVGTGYAVTISADEGGEILWNHSGRTLLRGEGVFKVGTDNILPFGSQTGPVVFSNPSWLDGNKRPTTLDLNGKTATVNGLLTEGDYGQYNLVTNSSENMATLLFNVETNAVLSGLIGGQVKFAANAASNIRLGKTGSGTLTIDKMTAVAGFDVVEGLVVGTANVSAGSVTATNGAALMVKSPYYNAYNCNQGFLSDSLVVDAGAGTTVLSNVWQQALVIRSGTARMENGSENIPAAERPWRPTKSQIGSVSIDSGALDVVRGCLSSTNITVAVGAELHVRGGAGATNRVEFQTSGLLDRYYRFIFKESAQKKTFGLNMLLLRSVNKSSEFSPTSNDSVGRYTLNESAASASGLAAGEYMFSCQNGLSFVESESGSIVYTKTGLSTRYGWGGVVINENGGLSLDDSATWVTVTIRLRDDATTPMVGYTLRQDWNHDKLVAWEVQASADGTSWRTVDERTQADIYAYSGNNFGWFNNGEPFGWRSLASNNAFNCAGTVRVDEGGVLDLSCVPDANIFIKSLSVDVLSGGGAIVKFRPAADGVLNIIGLVGELPNRYAVPLTLSNVSNIDNLKTWKVAVDGVELRRTEVVYSNGALYTHSVNGLVIVVR